MLRLSCKVSKVDDDIEAPLHAQERTNTDQGLTIRRATTLLGLQGFLGSRVGRPCHCNFQYEPQPALSIQSQSSQNIMSICGITVITSLSFVMCTYPAIVFSVVTFIRQPILHSPKMKPKKGKRCQQN